MDIDNMSTSEQHNPTTLFNDDNTDFQEPSREDDGPMDSEFKDPDLTDTDFLVCNGCMKVYHNTDDDDYRQHTQTCKNNPNINKVFQNEDDLRAAILEYQQIHEHYLPFSVNWHLQGPTHTRFDTDDEDENNNTNDDKNNNDESSTSSSSSDSDTSSDSSDDDSDSTSTEGENTPKGNNNEEKQQQSNATTDTNTHKYYLSSDEPPHVIKVTPEQITRHLWIHNQYFSNHGSEVCQLPKNMKQVQASECEHVLKIHMDDLRDNKEYSAPLDDHHFTREDLELMEIIKWETRQEHNQREYNRDIQRDIRHSIPSGQWNEQMITEERLDNELTVIQNNLQREGKSPYHQAPLHTSTSYPDYAFKKPSTFSIGQTAAAYQSGAMHQVKILSVTTNHNDTQHTFMLGDRRITTSMPLYKIEHSYKEQSQVDPFSETTPDYQDNDGWNDYDEFITNGMFDTPPERETPILYIEHIGQLKNLQPARYAKTQHDGRHIIRLMTNELVYNYSHDVYPRVQRFENRAESPFDARIIDLRMSRYKNETKINIPKIGGEYVHDDWNTDDRMQLVRITGTSGNGITFTRPGIIASHTSVGDFYEPIEKEFNQYDYNPNNYDTYAEQIKPGDRVMVKDKTMNLYVCSGLYNDGVFIGTQKQPAAWQTPPTLYTPKRRLYSEQKLSSRNLLGKTYIEDDLHGDLIRDPDIYSLTAGDTIKPGRAAMILEPQQNIMVPIIVTNNCRNGHTFTDEFDEEHYTSGNIHYPLTMKMNSTANMRGEYTIPRATIVHRKVGERVAYDDGSPFLLPAEVTATNHPQYDIMIDGETESITAHESSIHTPIQVSLSTVLQQKNRYILIEIAGNLLSTTTQNETNALTNGIITAAFPAATPPNNSNKDIFSTVKKQMEHDITTFTEDIDKIHTGVLNTTPTKSDTSSFSEPIVENPMNPSPQPKTTTPLTPQSWEQLPDSPIIIQPKRSAASITRGKPTHKRSVWDTPESTSSSSSSSSSTTSDENNHTMSPTTAKRVRDKIRNNTKNTLFSDSSESDGLSTPRKRLFAKAHTKPPVYPTPSKTTTKKQPVTASPSKYTLTKITDIIRNRNKCHKQGST
jgi:hypothetical protein